MIELEGRGVHEFLQVMVHGEHACHLKECLMGGHVEGTSHYFDHLILDTLEHVNNALDSFATLPVPELATICEYQETDCIHNEMPVGHGEPMDSVSEHFECANSVMFSDCGSKDTYSLVMTTWVSGN